MLTRIEIETRQPAPAKDDAAPYEILLGRFYGELDPAAPVNAIITDLGLAPVNARGRVEYSASFAIAKPVDLSRASGVALYDVPNRGTGWMGFGPDGSVLLNHMEADVDGHIRIVSGWQGDMPPVPGFQTATVPVATGPDGASLTGPVLVRLADMPSGAVTLPLAEGLAVPVSRPTPVSLETGKAQLLRLEADDLPAVPVPAEDWSFGDCASVPFPGAPDGGKISMRGGFDPAYTYLLVYEAKDPKVLGIGFAATRDLNAFLRYGTVDEAGTANPLAGSIEWVIAAGVSQAGNFLRSFVHLGFNAAEDGRIVFDGLNIQIAARQVPLNVRFGLPGGAANLYEIGSEGTLWWTRYDDTVRGRGVTSLLDRCNASGTCPKIVETFGSAEIWGLRMSPDLVGTDAKADLPLPANVRRYYFPGVTHFGSFVGGFSTEGDQTFPGMPKSVLAGNPNPSSETARVIPRILGDWVRDGKEPPASCYPTLAAGDLVEPTAQAMGWPAIPNAPVPDGKINAFIEYQLGDRFNHDDLSGVIDHQPPRIGKVMPSLVPRVDTDGNETVGVPSVQHLVPLGTYTGWNARAEGYGKGRSSGFFGGFIPFARTRAERLAANDPRLSLEERYGDHQGFVERVRKVAGERVAAGWLLPEDAEKLIGQAQASKVLID
jgi:hypothetical protein